MGRRSFAVFLAVAAVAAGGLLVARVGAAPADGAESPGSAAACVPRWSDATSPAVADGFLADVVARSPSDAWAVGGIRPVDTYGRALSERPLIEHWDGAAWSVVPTPPIEATLSSLSVSSETDAWAVGSGSSTVLHWDGSAWSQVLLPPAIRDTAAVYAAAPADAWIVGRYYNGRDVPVSQVAHWDGHAWSVVKTIVGVGLGDVTGSSSRDLWAVGFRGVRALAMHWDGARWRSYLHSPAPADMDGVPNTETLYTVTERTPRDVWAGGAFSIQGFLPPSEDSLLLHWNGRAWKQEKLPGEAVLGIAAGVGGEAWTAQLYEVGYHMGLVGGDATRSHRTKGRWRTAEVGAGRALFAVAAVPPAADAAGSADMWAVGQTGSGQSEDYFPLHTTPLIQRLDCNE